MTKIRTVKPELFRHEGLFEAEERERLPLRLVFIGLFTCCDREGRFRWRPRQLKLDILPYDTIDMSRALDVLATRGFIVKYTVGGEMYGCIPSWHKHQCINHRESDSVLPGLEQQVMSTESRVPDTSSTRDSPIDDATQACPGKVGENENGRVERGENDMELKIDSDQGIEHKARQISQVPMIEGDTYGHIQSGHKHQQANNNAPVSVLPGSERQTLSTESRVIDASGTRDSPANDATQACPGKPVGKWKGTGNGKGREMEQEMEKEREVEQEMEKEREVEQELERGRRVPVASTTRAAREPHAMLTVFEHWKTAMQQPDAKLDDKRQKIIQAALALGYTTAQLCEAIDGCCNTPHNMGSNEQGQRYDGLHIIFRDANQIERFIRNFHQPPRQLNKAEEHTQTNVKHLKRWLTKKNQSEKFNETH